MLDIHPTFKKMNFKQEQQILVLHAPKNFQEVLHAIQNHTTLYQEMQPSIQWPFVLLFVKEKVKMEQQISLVFPQLEPDAKLWVAYPKKSSKNYQSDISRDDGWQIFGKLGLEPVRMVAIDEDWSALRFRRVKFIKTITRSPKMALTDEAKKRSTKNKSNPED